MRNTIRLIKYLRLLILFSAGFCLLAFVVSLFIAIIKQLVVFWPFAFAMLGLSVVDLLIFILFDKAMPEIMYKLIDEPKFKEKIKKGIPRKELDEYLRKKYSSKTPVAVDEELNFNDEVVMTANFKGENGITIRKDAIGRVLSASNRDNPKIEFVSEETGEKISVRIPSSKLKKKMPLVSVEKKVI